MYLSIYIYTDIVYIYIVSSPQKDEGNKILQPGKEEGSFFKFLMGREVQMGVEALWCKCGGIIVWNLGEGLLSGISSMPANDNNQKKELDLFYLLYLLNIILVSDLFTVIYKSCVKFALPRSPYRFSTFNWNEISWMILNSSSRENKSLWFFVCSSGIKYGKQTYGVVHKHN